MSALWRRLGPAHQCRPTAQMGVAHAHLVDAETEFWCPECKRLWAKTSRHHLIGRKNVCGCGWVLVGVFTNAEALERFCERLRASQALVVGDLPTTLTHLDIARIIAEGRESH